MRGPLLIRLMRALDKGVVAPLIVLASLLRRRQQPRGGASPQPWVVIKLVGLGDAVLMLPALAAIQAAGKPVVVITTARCAGVFAASGCADRIVNVRRQGVLAALGALVRELRGCQGVLDFEQHVFWSAAVTMLAPAGAVRCGFRTVRRARNRAYDRLVDPGREPRPMKEIFDDLARAAGFAPARELRPLIPGGGATATVEAWLATHGLVPGRFIAVAPGSGATVPFRRLDAPEWAEVLHALPAGMPPVLVGAAGDAALIAGIVAAAARTAPGLKLMTLPTALAFDLKQLAAMFTRAAAVVATDSGPMHLAAAMGVPVVGIFGPDTPRRYAPYNSHSIAVSLNLPCSPCNNCWVYREARCTNPDAYACIRRLPPGRVAEAVAAVLARPPTR